MNDLLLMFNFCWQVLNYPLQFADFPTFTLLSVLKVTLILSLSGYCIHKIIFGLQNDD